MVCPACPVVVGSVAVGSASIFPALPWVATFGVGGASLAYMTGMGVFSSTPWGVSAVLTGIACGLYNYAHEYEYLPAANTGLDTNIRTFDSKKMGYKSHVCIEGTEQSNILKSDSMWERHFNGKWGANLFKGDNNYIDNFYFSLCTTNTIATNSEKSKYDLIWNLDLGEMYDFLTTASRYASIVYDFDGDHDKIRVFCSKHSVFFEQLHVSYSSVSNSTVVKIDVPYWRDCKVPYLEIDFTFLHNTPLKSLFYEELAVLVEGKHECLMGDNPTCLELDVQFSEICG